MEPPDTLMTLFRHHLWANLRLLERCAGLTREQLDATTPGTFGSIYDTLEHIVATEQSYYSQISTGKGYERPEEEPPLTFSQMEESLRRTGLGITEWAPRVRAEDTIHLVLDGTPRDVPKTIYLTQVINHATEHRAQIMTILTQVGIEPPDLQAWEYFDELNSRGP